MQFAIAALLALTSLSAQAGTVELSSRTVNLPVAINATNMKLSRADYATPVVKVLVPELADVTILNHRNTREGAPCLATYDTKKPQDVIQNNPSVEKVEFVIKLLKSAEPDGNGKCTVTLIEIVDAQIRGFAFTHERRQLVAERELADCR